VDIGLDRGEQVGAGPLLGCQALGAERSHLAIESIDIDRQWPVVFDHDLARDDRDRRARHHTRRPQPRVGYRVGARA
jgi:hypothetical protein